MNGEQYLSSKYYRGHAKEFMGGHKGFIT